MIIVLYYLHKTVHTDTHTHTPTHTNTHTHTQPQPHTHTHTHPHMHTTIREKGIQYAGLEFICFARVVGASVSLGFVARITF